MDAERIQEKEPFENVTKIVFQKTAAAALSDEDITKIEEILEHTDDWEETFPPKEMI